MALVAADVRHADSAASNGGVGTDRHRNTVRFATRSVEFWFVICFLAVCWFFTMAPGWTLPDAVGAVAYSSAVTAFFGLLLWRWIACCVIVTPEHVLIENLLRRVLVPRDEMDRFEFDKPESKAVAVLMSGRRVTCYGVQQTNLRRSGGPARRITDEMNAALSDTSPSGPAPV